MLRFTVLTCFSMVISFYACAKEKKETQKHPPTLEGAKVEVYKTVGNVELNAYIFEPAFHSPSDRRPSIVFFFGGGWKGGTPKQFYEHCRHLASRGMVAVSADYRVLSRHGTKATSCVSDAKSAVRWLRKNSDRLGIDPDRIAAGGGSAGGHIAACTGVVAGYDELGEDTSISSVPNALVLFNPALVLAKVDGALPLKQDSLDGLTERVGEDPINISPLHQLKGSAPPTLILHGTADETVLYWTVEAFAKAMQNAGNRCEVVGYEGEGHGFFNHGRGDNSNYTKTVRAMEEFLISLDYLPRETR